MVNYKGIYKDKEKEEYVLLAIKRIEVDALRASNRKENRR